MVKLFAPAEECVTPKRSSIFLKSALKSKRNKSTLKKVHFKCKFMKPCKRSLYSKNTPGKSPLFMRNKIGNPPLFMKNKIGNSSPFLKNKIGNPVYLKKKAGKVGNPPWLKSKAGIFLGDPSVQSPAAISRRVSRLGTPMIGSRMGANRMGTPMVSRRMGGNRMNANRMGANRIGTPAVGNRMGTNRIGTPAIGNRMGTNRAFGNRIATPAFIGGGANLHCTSFNGRLPMNKSRFRGFRQGALPSIMSTPAVGNFKGNGRSRLRPLASPAGNGRSKLRPLASPAMNKNGFCSFRGGPLPSTLPAFSTTVAGRNGLPKGSAGFRHPVAKTPFAKKNRLRGSFLGGSLPPIMPTPANFVYSNPRGPADLTTPSPSSFKSHPSRLLSTTKSTRRRTSESPPVNTLLNDCPKFLLVE